jgi:hypothetical protein
MADGGWRMATVDRFLRVWRFGSLLKGHAVVKLLEPGFERRLRVQFLSEKENES